MNFEMLRLKCSWVTVLGHMTSSVTSPLACPWGISYRCSVGTDTLSPRDFEILRHKCIWVTVLTFLGHVTSSVTWPLACPRATSYRCSIGTDTLSPRNFEILRLKFIWFTVLTFLGHVTSSVTWPFFPRYVVSYRWSVDTSFLTGTVTEIGPYLVVKSYQCYVKPGLRFPCVNGHIAHCACAVSRDLVEWAKNNHIFGIPDPYLPIHYTTFRVLRWWLRVVTWWKFYNGRFSSTIFCPKKWCFGEFMGGNFWIFKMRPR